MRFIARRTFKKMVTLHFWKDQKIIAFLYFLQDYIG